MDLVSCQRSIKRFPVMFRNVILSVLMHAVNFPCYVYECLKYFVIQKYISIQTVESLLCNGHIDGLVRSLLSCILVQ